MSSRHRPLSAWTATLSPRTGQLGPVNDGDHRSDARELDHFADGWHRVAVPWGPDVHVLGLAHDDGTTVVELDDFGRPIIASRQTVEVIDRIEQRWPTIDSGTADMFRELSSESLSLRYWLLERLDAEAHPPDEVFAILPWELLDRAVEAVEAGLRPAGTLGELVEVQHWLTPAVLGLTGPVEQLDHGLRTGNRLIARFGANALLTALCEIPLSRVPARSRACLSRLVSLLEGLDPLYRHACRVAAARLSDRSEARRIRTELHSSLEAAAGTENVREHIEILGDGLQRVQLVETQAGWVRVTAQLLRAHAAEDGPLAERVGCLLPVRITPSDGGPVRRLWIALSDEDDHLEGTITVALPQGRSAFEADAAPVGAQDLNDADPADVLASLDAGTATTALAWLDVAEKLMETHPVRVAARAFEERS
ncbi:hypothetical protein [Herbidospora cretacea]|uniref:hypothetical protein n=1 Tax=Herbidospora cretacea TaxID=28444 RepID=UPI0004C455B6|nr:hypothetical protein [Herbidospora cretacea]